MRRGKPWTERELQILRDLYPATKTQHIADQLGRPVKHVYSRAYALGLAKSQAFLNSTESGRLRGEKGKSFRFPKGHVPANKGLRRPGWGPGRMKETQFKPGRKPHHSHNYKPIGTTRITRDGMVERKVTDDPSLYPARRWVAVPRLVWEAAHGPIPKGHAIIFKPGMHTTNVDEITVDKLECLSRGELMQRNSYHTRYPKEIGLAIQARGALMRQVNKRLKQAEETEA